MRAPLTRRYKHASATNVDGLVPTNALVLTGMVTLLESNSEVNVGQFRQSVLPGQCVFLRNEHSGREILCKVLESRQGGVAHYTDLEFVDRDPKFWDVSAEQPVAARQTPEIQKIKPGGTSPVATLGMEPSSRPGGDIPLTFLKTNTMAPVCPESTNQPEWNDAKDQELVAALIAIRAPSSRPRENPTRKVQRSPSERRRSRMLQSKARQFRTPQTMRKYFQRRHPGFAVPARSRRTGIQLP